MPRNGVSVPELVGLALVRPRALGVGHLDRPSAEHVSERGPMGVLHVDCAWGNRAAQDADLGVLVQVFAEFLALPLHGKRVGNILVERRAREGRQGPRAWSPML